MLVGCCGGRPTHTLHYSMYQFYGIIFFHYSLVILGLRLHLGNVIMLVTTNSPSLDF